MSELIKARRELAKAVDSFIDTINTKIKHSENVDSEVVFVSDSSMATLTHGKIGDTTKVAPNPFNATLVVFKGGVDIVTDKGEHHAITESKRCLYLPKFTGFELTGTHEVTSVLTIVDKL